MIQALDPAAAALRAVVFGQTQESTVGLAESLQSEIAASQDGLEPVVEDSGPAGPSKWSSAEPFQFQLIRQYVVDAVFGGSIPSGMTALVNAFVNEWGAALAVRETGDDGKERIVRWPSPDEIVADAQFANGAQFLPYAANLMEMFPQGKPGIFHDAETGEFFKVTYDPRTGLEMEATANPGNAPAAILGASAGGPEDLIRQVRGYATGEIPRPDLSRVPEGVLTSLDPEAQAGIGLEPTTTNIRGGTDRIYTLPTVRPMTDLVQAVTPPQPSTRGRTGAAGPKLDWDRRKLTQMYEEAHRSWLFEDPAGGLSKSAVDEYIAEATGFWHRSGGRILDYQAFVKERLRANPRYQTIFQHKPKDVEEDEFIMTYAAPVARVGLGVADTREQVQRSIQSGGSAAGQVTRVTRTREGSEATGFGQRFASKLAGLGAGVKV
jgi:hypothetical protein